MSTTLYDIRGDIWHPHALSKGPFAGQHGGAVAGALAAALEIRAKAIHAGTGLQMTCLLLRPAAIEPVEILVSELRRGERMSVLRAQMQQGDRLIAEATGVFVIRQLMQDVPVPTPIINEPGTQAFDIGQFSDIPWFRDAVDIRRDSQGWYWLKHRMPVVQTMGPLCFTASLSDWTSGMTRPEWFGSNKIVGFPNSDLTIHLAREPEGTWLGIEGYSKWQPEGSGLAFANLYDETGFVGRAAQSLVLVAGG